MKRVILFTILILAVLFVPSQSFAQEEDLNPSVSPSPTPTLTPKPVDYQLPYPGLLPDSPLYFLKIGRDRIIDFLISDPLKQAEFDLLQAEKRFASGIALFEKEKKELAVTTISKGQNYFEKAIQNIEIAKTQGIDTSSLLEKMYRSARKQQEILRVQKGMEPLLKRLQGFEEKVNKLREK
ncbi:MAG: DUF5667 domain-containing protein [bacterium]|nr:DUF5667 domain-containing protein [bacterium]